MSQESVERIFGKIVLDAGFRDALMADPDAALAGFQLTEAEKTVLKRIDAETLDMLAILLKTPIDHWHKKTPINPHTEQEKIP